MDLLDIMVQLDGLADKARTAGAPKTRAAIEQAVKTAEVELPEVRQREAERRTADTHQSPAGPVPGRHGWGRAAVLRLHPGAVCKAAGNGHCVTLWPDGPSYQFAASSPRAWCLTARALGCKPPPQQSADGVEP